MPSFNEITPVQLMRLVGTPEAPRDPRPLPARGLRARPRADPHRPARLARRARTPPARAPGPPRRLRLPAGPQGQPRRGGAAARARARRRGAGGRRAGLARRRPAHGPRGRDPGAASRHALGHAPSPQDRPHRLPLADPALRGPRGAHPLRPARGCGGRGPTIRGRALRRRGRLLVPSRPRLHLRHHGGGVRALALGARRARDRWCGPRTPIATRSRPRRRGSWRSRSASRAPHRDDLAQLEAGMVLYDALYRWARDGQGEGHDWPADRAA